MLVLQGCVQSVVSAHTNQAAARVLGKLGIELIVAPQAGCCGAMSHHLSAAQQGLDFMRRNIDAWWSYVEEGIESIVITASGCGVVVKDYAELLKHDPNYSNKAKKISELARDISEVVDTDNTLLKNNTANGIKVAFQNPCTLQHGQKITGSVEKILNNAGYTLVEVEDAHLCCGSAGTYSILQPQLATKLLTNKLTALQRQQPDVIVTANIGCQLHLKTKANTPVKHWIELLDEGLA